MSVIHPVELMDFKLIAPLGLKKYTNCLSACFVGGIHHARLVAGLLVRMKTLYFACIFVRIIVVTVSFCLFRADKQEKLNINGTVIQNAQNVTKELDMVFYLGIYGGNLMFECSCCSHVNMSAVEVWRIFWLFLQV